MSDWVLYDAPAGWHPDWGFIDTLEEGDFIFLILDVPDGEEVTFELLEEAGFDFSDVDISKGDWHKCYLAPLEESPRRAKLKNLIRRGFYHDAITWEELLGLAKAPLSITLGAKNDTPPPAAEPAMQQEETITAATQDQPAAAEAQGPAFEQSAAAEQTTEARRVRGPTDKTRMLAELAREIKEQSPHYSRERVASAVRHRIESDALKYKLLAPEADKITKETIRYAYRAMGWKWEAARRIR